jgi:hypothetical protein
MRILLLLLPPLHHHCLMPLPLLSHALLCHVADFTKRCIECFCPTQVLLHHSQQHAAATQQQPGAPPASLYAMLQTAPNALFLPYSSLATWRPPSCLYAALFNLAALQPAAC